MAQLKKTTTKKVTLTRSGDVPFEVELYDRILVGRTREAARGIDPKNMTQTDGSVMTALALIKDWDLFDDAGNKLPVTLENVDLLDLMDIDTIIRAADTNALNPEQKKTSKRK